MGDLQNKKNKIYYRILRNKLNLDRKSETNFESKAINICR